VTTDCETPPEDFATLCRAYELVTAHYVDRVEDQELAAAAVRGIAENQDDDPDQPIPETLTCALPSEAFHTVCEAAAEELAGGEVDVADTVEAAVRGMVQFGLDPYSSYLTPQAKELLGEDQTGTIEGIGALVTTQDSTDPEGPPCPVVSATCRLVIVAPLEGSPAEEAGVQSEDVIVAVDGHEVTGQTLDEVSSLIRGPAGTDVTITIERGDELLDVTIERAPITVPVVESEMVEPGVGHLRLLLFSNNSTGQVRLALQDLIADGAHTIVLDLQDNPGGSLNAAVSVASEFLVEGLVLQTRAPDGTIDYRVEDGGVATDPDLEVWVLVNRASASASEVVAAALQEAGRATLIGENTFGKNTVQQQFDLPNQGALKLTIARWVTPAGVDYGSAGITPDVAVEIPVDADADFLLQETLGRLG
ncbi:MAG: S41 family peptidase, partial [Acidimicrobiia bacterium]